MCWKNRWIINFNKFKVESDFNTKGSEPNELLFVVVSNLSSYIQYKHTYLQDMRFIKTTLFIFTTFAISKVSVEAFAPTPFHSRTNNVNNINRNVIHNSPTTSSSITSSTTSSTSTTQLNFGAIVNVPDDFFTITGISLGFAYTILRSWNRVTVENVAWENRLEDARQTKLDQEFDDSGSGKSSTNVNSYTELDLRRMDAAASKSAYGPDAMAARERERKGKARRVRTMEEDAYYNDNDNDQEEEDERSDRVYNMNDEQINEFEETYGVEYDAYYDEPYTMDELPDDMSFVEDKVYGDRRYENGEIFYQDEGNKSVYWRQGGRPRLKQFWELL